ncbi:MAG: acyltransferase family protein [Bacteroides sp.]|uniref:acyltransferase family protein n=1 Tax=Bacteroides sp. TaxID=29523 RepID=UPI0026E0193F|nr:acyltransferase family protein [Bacteroides sp.]MDO5419500.1 acyltransferase family protein [Bacteroides sp.]
MVQHPLNEIVLYRAVVTLLLIATHSFTIFSGGGGDWPYPPGIEPCNLYVWILHFAAHAMLGGFTFISGYLLVHQRDKMLQQSYKTFMFRKSRRLLLPGILFSLLYIWMFEEHAFSALLRFCYTLSDGHMWYLPMLMWCLFYGYYLLKHDISLKKAAIVSLFLLSLYFLPLPFNLRKFFLYVPYFTLGMMAYAYRDWIIRKSELLLKGGGICACL